jgi:hypothetical protein
MSTHIYCHLSRDSAQQPKSLQLCRFEASLICEVCEQAHPIGGLWRRLEGTTVLHQVAFATSGRMKAKALPYGF